MSEIDLPAVKQFLWHKMRSDLISFVPEFSHNELLLCPTCCRRMKYEDFSLEHIIPKQALSNDPPEVRAEISNNERSGLTLLCRKQLVIGGKPIRGNGCNGWKGKHYDKWAADILKAKAPTDVAQEKHHIALVAVGFLGLFHEYGYQTALSQAGLLMRRQFFSPRGFVKGMPIRFQVLFTRNQIENEKDEAKDYWNVPFKTNVDDDSAMVIFRNFSVPLPLSRNPKSFISRTIQYVPYKYAFRPDLSTVFD